MKWWHVILSIVAEKVPDIIRAIKGSEKDPNNSKAKEEKDGNHAAGG